MENLADLAAAQAAIAGSLADYPDLILLALASVIAVTGVGIALGIWRKSRRV